MTGWMNSYNGSGEIIEIIVRDSTGAKIDSFKASSNNFYKIVKIINRKYGLSDKKQDDLAWAKKDLY